MLLQFNFRNFKSFRDDTSLDLTATKITENSFHIVSIGNEKVLPIAAIYGANASGKSNIHEAFRYMTLYVLDSFGYGDEAKMDDKKSRFRKPTPFLFDSKSKDEESFFEVYFIDNKDKYEKTFNYGFTLNKEGVKEEWLNCKSKSPKSRVRSIFYREGKNLDLSGLPESQRENIKRALTEESLVVSLGAKLKINKLKVVRDWFNKNDAINFGAPIDNLFLARRMPQDFAKSLEVQQKVVEYINSFDSSIVGFDVVKIKRDNDEDDDYQIKTKHKVIDSNQIATINLSQESAGTLKMLALYPWLDDIMKNGGVFFVDELNARLHPLLVRAIIITFTNPKINTNKAQLIFTSYDSWQLNNDVFRRDEIWFTEKNDSGISNLYSLVDFVDDAGSKIRKDENYEKNYFLGKYGAIPKLKDIVIFK